MLRPAFEHFEPSAFQFFEDLALNNTRAWFHENKQRYENDVADPVLAFVARCSLLLAGVSPHFEAVPKKHGGSLFRIYRDTRFSRDKRPYRENAACRFSHARQNGINGPCFYFHLEPNKIVLGGGIWHPGSEDLFKIRSLIAEKPELWIQAKKQLFETGFYTDIEGEKLTRPPRNFGLNTPCIDDIKLKSFFAVYEADKNVALQKDFIAHVHGAFAAAMPLLRFICTALKLPC